MIHHFSVAVAEKLGINAAIIAENIKFWCARNEANESSYHFRDGRYWTYNSRTAYQKLFPYMSEKQIRSALDKLVETGLIIAGSYNSDKRDRTKWYSYNGLHWANALAPEGQSHWPLRANALAPEGQPLPDINTDNKPDNKLGAQLSARLMEQLDAHCACGATQLGLAQLMKEAEAYDGRRVLVTSPYAFDKINEALSRPLRAAGLILTRKKSEMSEMTDA